MIHVPPAEPDDPGWKAWRDKVEKARENLIQAVEGGAAPEILESLYKAQKELLLRAFNYKCGYCEVRLAGNQPGDVEHFRPKKDVTDESLQPVFDGERRHPGYYWLAYDWFNLIPSCIECNRPSTSPEGRPRGKRNRFPVRGFRAFKPGDEKREEPLLLNPWKVDDPGKHLTFGDELGVLGAETEEGTKTLEVLDLNREGLLEARKEAYGQVKGLLLRWTAALIEGQQELAAKLKGELEEYEAGQKPHSAVGRCLIEKTRKELARI